NHPYDANIIKNYDQSFLNELPEPQKKSKKMSQKKKRNDSKEKVKNEKVGNKQKIMNVDNTVGEFEEGKN
ncbi:4199_t:CDS:1, partial [Acaulospora morrowiae]